MKDRIVVARYAEAFVGYARSTIGLPQALKEAQRLRSNVIRPNPEFLQFLLNPEITHAEKSGFIGTVLAEFPVELRRFTEFLVEKGRIDKLPDIIEYIRLTYAHQGETDALVRTAFPLDIEVVREIKATLESKLKRKFKFFIELDGSLLGGVQVIIGNTILDGSVRKRLSDLRKQLETIRV